MTNEQWPALNPEKRRVDALIPYATNSRTHTDEQVAQIAASIKEWGWTNPILVDEDGLIIAGHGRVMACPRLGIDEVPVVVAKGWTDAQKKAYVLADNQLALNAGWNDDLLRTELQQLKEWGFDTDLIGFENVDAMTVEKNDGLTDPDDVPDLPDDPVTKPGDLWVLGRHRLKCGDSTVATDVEDLLGEVKPHLMVTDPPYGVEYDADWRIKAIKGNQAGGTATGVVMNDDRADWSEAWALFPGDVAYVWHSDKENYQFSKSLVENGYEIRAQIIWAKSSFVISRGHYHSQHEPCFYAVKSGAIGHWAGDRKQSTIWQIDKPRKSETGHSTQKPVECMRRPIVNNSSPGQAVYEPFSGSGTTIIAGEMEGRAIYAMELSPEYVDVAVKRWQEFTGEQAILESTGEPFKESDG